MKTVELNIDGMTCGHCARLVEMALQSVPGTEDVQVNLDEGRASLEAAQEVEVSQLLGAVEKAGYRGSPVAGASGGTPQGPGS